MPAGPGLPCAPIPDSPAIRSLFGAAGGRPAPVGTFGPSPHAARLPPPPPRCLWDSRPHSRASPQASAAGSSCFAPPPPPLPSACARGSGPVRLPVDLLTPPALLCQLQRATVSLQATQRSGMLQQHAGLARQLAPAWRHLAPAAVAGLHSSSAALQEAALQTAPQRMSEVAEVVKEVMGEGSDVVPAVTPLPPAQLNFSDPREAFKVRPRNWVLCPAGLPQAPATCRLHCCIVQPWCRPACPNIRLPCCKPSVPSGQVHAGHHALAARLLLLQNPAAGGEAVQVPVEPPALPVRGCWWCGHPPPPVCACWYRSASSACVPEPWLPLKAQHSMQLAVHLPLAPTSSPTTAQQAHADSVLAWSKKVFGSTLTNAVIRHTFYKQAGVGQGLLPTWLLWWRCHRLGSTCKRTRMRICSRRLPPPSSPPAVCGRRVAGGVLCRAGRAAPARHWRDHVLCGE